MLPLLLTLHLLAPQPLALRPLTLLPARAQIAKPSPTPVVREFLLATGASVVVTGVTALILVAELASTSDGLFQTGQGTAVFLVAAGVYVLGAPLVAAVGVSALADYLEHPGSLGLALGGALVGSVLGAGIVVGSFALAVAVIDSLSSIQGDVGVTSPWAGPLSIGIVTTGFLLSAAAVGVGAVIGLNLQRPDDARPALPLQPVGPSLIDVPPPLATRVAPTARGLTFPVLSLRFD